MKQQVKKIVCGVAGIFAAMILLFSCENSDDVDYGYGEYYEELVTAKGNDVFLLDNGKTLINASKNTGKSVQAGDRVLLNYTLLSEKTTGYDYTVRVNGLSKIPLGDLKPVDQKTIDAAVNDPVLFESLWLGSHYLNLQFYFNYKSEQHYIGLLTDSTLLKNDTIHIYFRHDPQNDKPGYSNKAILSVDMEKTLGKPEKKKVLLLNISTINYGEKQYELKY
jgi:hypothetical protein